LLDIGVFIKTWFALIVVNVKQKQT